MPLSCRNAATPSNNHNAHKLPVLGRSTGRERRSAPLKNSIGRCLLSSALLLAVAAASPALLAQEARPAVGAIVGNVKTSDGRPVDDAVVTLIATRTSTAVDDDGSFRLENIPPGMQLVEVTSLRHARTVARVTVVAGETLELDVLVQSRLHTEQIVVSASPGQRGELDLASAVNVLQGRELALRLEPTIGETLSDEVGVNSTYFSPGASRPLIRGLGGDRVKMLENGTDSLDVSSSSPDHAVATDSLSAERVEVLRGPATLLYGSNAIGGVVNVIDGRIPQRPPVGSFSGIVDLRAGSVSDERAAGASLRGGGSRWAWSVDGLTRETDDYDIPGHAEADDEHADDEHDDDDDHDDDHDDEHSDEAPEGTLPNSDLRASSVGAGTSYFFGDKGYVGVSVRSLDSEYGIPGGHHHDEGDEHGDDDHDDDEHGDDDHDEGEHDEHGDEEGEEEIRIDMRQLRYDFEGAITRSLGAFQSVDFRLGIVDYEHDELEGPGVVGTSFSNDGYEGRVEVVQKTRGPHSGSFGLQLRSRDLVVLGEEAFIPPTDTQNLGFFTFQEISRGDIRYQAGVRYESQSTEVISREFDDRDFDGLSASLGLVWRATPGYSLGVSLARSVKAPSGEELYSDGVHFATSAFEVGDPGLEEESAVGLDVTLRRVEGRVTGAFNLFFNQFGDFIFQDITGEEEEDFPVLRWSQADADFWGAELDISILLVENAHSSWDLDLFWDFVRAEFQDGSALPRIPAQRFGAGVHYRGDRLSAGAEIRWVDDQNRITTNETPTDGFAMVGANASYRFFFDSSFLDVILRGTNLTDEEARLHTSFVKDDVPLPGRNISLIARLGF